MPEPTACARARSSPDSDYCDRCDLLVGLDGFHIIDVAEREDRRGWRCGRTHLPDRGMDRTRGRSHVSVGAADHAGVLVGDRSTASRARLGGPSGPAAGHDLADRVDLTRDTKGRVRARLLDLVPGRSGKAYADWLKERGDAPPPGPAGHPRTPRPEGDALYGIRMLLRAGAEKLTDRQRRRLAAAIGGNEAHLEVWLAWACAQRLRAAYRHPNPVEGRRIAERVVETFRPAP